MAIPRAAYLVRNRSSHQAQFHWPLLGKTFTLNLDKLMMAQGKRRGIEASRLSTSKIAVRHKRNVATTEADEGTKLCPMKCTRESGGPNVIETEEIVSKDLLKWQRYLGIPEITGSAQMSVQLGTFSPNPQQSINSLSCVNFLSVSF